MESFRRKRDRSITEISFPVRRASGGTAGSCMVGTRKEGSTSVKRRIGKDEPDEVAWLSPYKRLDVGRPIR